MTRTLLTGNGAAAWGARLAECEYLPAFPITPQTEIIETLAKWHSRKEFECRMVTMDSEHSMIAAAGAAAVTGVRVFTATSSQGLLYGMEMLYTVAGWRAPFVMVNVSRGLAAPITLEPDHNDIFAARDSGCLQLHCSTCQEVVDCMLIAYRLAEDKRIRLPVIVNLDGFYLSFTREPVTLPESTKVKQFLPPYNPENLGFKYKQPLSEAVAVLGGSSYSYFRYQSHLANLNGLEVFEECTQHYRDIFGQNYAAVENYQADDADYVFVMIGSFATKAKDAVNLLRQQGKKAGLVRPLLIRPFPAQILAQLLKNKKAVIIIDQNLAPGRGGVLHTEIAASLYQLSSRTIPLLNYIGGLGGRDISTNEFYAMAKEAEDAIKNNTAPPPRLLYTSTELKEMEKMQLLTNTDQRTKEVS